MEWIDDNHMDLEKIGKAFQRNENIAFISSDNATQKTWQNSQEASSQAQIVRLNSQQVKILSYDFNHVQLKTNYDQKKFLVYNDCFHSGWQVFVNGHKADLLRANIAFKGVWLPPGENIVYFKFGNSWRHAMNWAFMLIFPIVLITMFIFLVKDRRIHQKPLIIN